MEEPLDRFGNPLPPDPGYKEIWNADGTKPRSWEKLVLGADLSITSDEANKASVLNVSLPSLGNPIQFTASVTGNLRTWGNIPTDGTLIQTREYGVYGAGLGGWMYRWDSASVATDDGVLVIKADFLDTGRFLAVKPADGIMNALACGPAAADLGTRTKSFDPAGAVAIGAELFRVTKLLRVAGWAGIEFPKEGDGYFGNGTELLGTSPGPNQPFYIGSKSGAIWHGDISSMHEVSAGIGACAQGEGDTGSTSTVIDCRHAGNKLFTQTILGGESTFTGLDSVSGLAAGDTVIVYFGEETTDDSGWCASWMMAEISAIVGSDVTTIQVAPGPMPADAGLHRAQTSHAMRKVIGFQDGLTVSGFVFKNAAVGFQFARDYVVDCHWEYTSFCLNMFACSGGSVPRWTADFITGYDQGGPGPFSWYGAGCVLQSCYGTKFGVVKIELVDGVPLLSEELSCRGTRVDSMDVTFDSRNAWNESQTLVGQTGGSTDIISLGILITRGFGQATCLASVSGEVWEERGYVNNSYSLRADQFDRVFWRGQGYRGYRPLEFMLEIPTTGTAGYTLPCSGLIRRMFLLATTVTNLTTLTVDGSAEATEANVVGSMSTPNEWHDINQASIMAGFCPNYKGYCTPHIVVGSSSGSIAANSFLYVRIEMFDPELATDDQVLTVDTSPLLIRTGSGAPSYNARYIGDQYIDVDASPRKWYRSVSVGAGASDWVALS